MSASTHYGHWGHGRIEPFSDLHFFLEADALMDEQDRSSFNGSEAGAG